MLEMCTGFFAAKPIGQKESPGSGERLIKKPGGTLDPFGNGFTRKYFSANFPSYALSGAPQLRQTVSPPPGMAGASREP
jgi:hypothetical protein